MYTYLHLAAGVGTCSYGPCTRVLPQRCWVVDGVAYCSHTCGDADRKASPFYRRMGNDFSW